MGVCRSRLLLNLGVAASGDLRNQSRRDRIEAMAASRGEVNASIERFKRRRTMSESGSSIAITKVTPPDSIKPEADTDT